MRPASLPPTARRLVSYATRATQNTDAAVAWGCCGAAVLEKVVCGLPPSKAVAATVAELRGEAQVGRVLGGYMRRLAQVRRTAAGG